MTIEQTLEQQASKKIKGLGFTITKKSLGGVVDVHKASGRGADEDTVYYGSLRSLLEEVEAIVASRGIDLANFRV